MPMVDIMAIRTNAVRGSVEFIALSRKLTSTESDVMMFLKRWGESTIMYELAIEK